MHTAVRYEYKLIRIYIGGSLDPYVYIEDGWEFVTLDEKGTYGYVVFKRMMREIGYKL